MIKTLTPCSALFLVAGCVETPTPHEPFHRPFQGSVASQVGQALQGTRIAFSSVRDGNSEIYVMDPDGSNPTNLTKHPATDGVAAWSPDGAKIAFSTNRDGNFEVYVMSQDGSNPTNLTNHPASDGTPAWSLDGTKIAFRSDRAGNFDIYVANADGSNPVNVTNNAADDGGPTWSPDGSEIAFASDRDGNQEIYVVELASLLVRRLTNAPGVDIQPAWSPDGTKIAWTANDPTGNVSVMDAQDGGNVMILAPFPASDPSWSPDGAKIAFVAPCVPACEISTMNSDGTNRVNVTNHPADDQQPAWSPFTKLILPTDGDVTALFGERAPAFGERDVPYYDSNGEFRGASEEPNGRWHHGVDIAGFRQFDRERGIINNREVIAAGDGLVIYAGSEPPHGDVVAIRHNRIVGPPGRPHVYTFYSHMGNKNPRRGNFIMVSPGEVVKAGEIIGCQGNSGATVGRGPAGGTHLHFEIRVSSLLFEAGDRFAPDNDMILISPDYFMVQNFVSPVIPGARSPAPEPPLIPGGAECPA